MKTKIKYTFTLLFWIVVDAVFVYGIVLTFKGL